MVALVFLPGILSGTLLVHVLWPDRRPASVVFKIFLGIGIGLGLRSLLYFLCLLLVQTGKLFTYLEVIVLLVLLAVVWRQERNAGTWKTSAGAGSQLGLPQRLMLLVASLVFVTSLLATANYLLRRRQGDWDAWMMYNRAARFLYYDQTHWRQSFSPSMDPIFHADYPLLLASNIAAGWDMLGRESPAVPMLQSALFALGCVGLIAGSLALTSSIGQAALGVTMLWGIPVFVNEGARQMADVPMAFFMLSTGTLLHLYTIEKHRGLLVLAGLAAGLAAWTKNEGMVLLVGAAAALTVMLFRTAAWRGARIFAAGLALPLAVTLYFKICMAPSGDILSGATGGAAAQLTDVSRHTLIFRHIWSEIAGFGSWGIPGLSLGAIPILFLLYLAFRSPVPSARKLGYSSLLIILGIQMLGYYTAYLVSPYDLDWHLSYSSTRIVLQVFPLALFLVLTACRSVEMVMSGRSPEAVNA